MTPRTDQSNEESDEIIPFDEWGEVRTPALSDDVDECID